MKYSDQGKKMKMAGGGVAEDMKPIGKNLGGLLKSPLVQAVSPAAMIYDKLGKENRGFMLGLAPGLFMKDRARRKKDDEANIS